MVSKNNYPLNLFFEHPLILIALVLADKVQEAGKYALLINDVRIPLLAVHFIIYFPSDYEVTLLHDCRNRVDFVKVLTHQTEDETAK